MIVTALLVLSVANAVGALRETKSLLYPPEWSGPGYRRFTVVNVCGCVFASLTTFAAAVATYWQDGFQ